MVVVVDMDMAVLEADRVVAQDKEVDIQAEVVAVAALDDEGIDADYDILGIPFRSHSIQGEGGNPPYFQD